MDGPDKIKGAAPREENAPFKILPANRTKENAILAILKSGQSLNRFEAEHFGDPKAEPPIPPIIPLKNPVGGMASKPTASLSR